MRKFLVSVVAACGITFAVYADSTPQVRLKTNMGDIVISLNSKEAPVTVSNFLSYVNEGFYNGTIFHRVIDGFMIQGGGFSDEFDQKRPGRPIPNEADNGLKNLRGTIAMARTQDPHSATSQFFINVVDNPNLDHKSPTLRGWGYAVFGRIAKGMEVVDKIRKVQTTSRLFYRDVPVKPIVIEQAAVETAPNQE